MATLKKKKTLYLPNDVPHPEVEALAFIYDSKGIAVLSKEPDAFLTIFYFDKADTIVMGRASNSNHKNLTSLHISCNLSDTGLVAVGGKCCQLKILIEFMGHEKTTNFKIKIYI